MMVYRYVEKFKFDGYNINREEIERVGNKWMLRMEDDEHRIHGLYFNTKDDCFAVFNILIDSARD